MPSKEFIERMRAVLEKKEERRLKAAAQARADKATAERFKADCKKIASRQWGTFHLVRKLIVETVNELGAKGFEIKRNGHCSLRVSCLITGLSFAISVAPLEIWDSHACHRLTYSADLDAVLIDGCGGPDMTIESYCCLWFEYITEWPYAYPEGFHG